MPIAPRPRSPGRVERRDWGSISRTCAVSHRIESSRSASVFSAKEAIFKAFFPRHGAFFGFDAVHLDACDGGFVATLRIALAGWPAGSCCEVQSRRQGPFVLSSVYLAPPEY